MMKDVFRKEKGRKKVIVSTGVDNLRKGTKYRVLSTSGSFQSTNTKDFKKKSDAVKYAKKYLD